MEAAESSAEEKRLCGSTGVSDRLGHVASDFVVWELVVVVKTPSRLLTTVDRVKAYRRRRRQVPFQLASISLLGFRLCQDRRIAVGKRVSLFRKNEFLTIKRVTKCVYTDQDKVYPVSPGGRS
jgi:hypothetical protein